MATTFPNIYHHRKVADTSSKPCEDFFYSCPGHLKDKGFCSPVVDKDAEAAKAAKKKKELDDEMAKVKEEYEAKQRQKKEEEAKKEKDDENKGKDKDKDEPKGKGGDKADDSKKKADKADEKSQTDKEEASAAPRVFALHRTFYQQRIEKKRQAEMAKRNRQRLQDPNFFPSVPKGRPS
ncbi:hypothetical protein MKZ38_007676 [Zalerion maritima]|uniref:Uncharacterized protein n=1 Tax=Zalerion maritima TaxID=339359 RepID=A0AAD5S081_9PEZI|nr:hypothetical protein MKZ38_007676 [Zalerion maritima]